MEVQFAVLADSANASREGKLNISGIFDRVFAPKFPANHLGAQLVIRCGAHTSEAGNEHTLRVAFADADGTVLARLEGTIKIPVADDPGAPLTLNLILAVPVIPLPAPGLYAFDVFVDDRWATAVPLAATAPVPGRTG